MSDFLDFVNHTMRKNEAKMEMNKEVPIIPKKEFDSLCPFCKSRAVYRIGAHIAEPPGPFKTPYDPGSYIEEWRCAVCYESFELF